MPREIHFEIPSTIPNRALKLYQQVFGWEFRKWDGPMDYWLIQTGSDDQPGINGGMIRRTGAAGTLNTIDVPSVDDFVAKIEAHGGEIVLSKQAIPGVGWLAYAKDTEGVIFGVMQADKSAH